MLSPISCSDNPDRIDSHRETNTEYPAFDSPDAKQTILDLTVVQVFKDDALGIGEGVYCCFKRHAVLQPVLDVFIEIPFEDGVA